MGGHFTSSMYFIFVPLLRLLILISKRYVLVWLDFGHYLIIISNLWLMIDSIIVIRELIILIVESILLTIFFVDPAVVISLLFLDPLIML